jgi:glycosyltransferase involved in cell wall biosynthesis
VLEGLTSVELTGRWNIWIGLGLSLLIAILFIRARTNHLKIPKLTKPIHTGVNPDRPPDCMVVIPARNEAGFIGRAVASLPHDSVIVVDDDSDDATAEEARKAGGGVIKAPQLSRSAFGKSNACMAGARTITSRWILFADADTCYAPGFLDAAIASAESGAVALLSVYLDPEYGTVWEHAIAPYLTALFFCGSNPSKEVALAFNGQCLLVRRDGYEFLGGHAAVLTVLTEDIRLAAIAERHRLKFGIVRANGLGRARFRDMRGTVQRGAFRFMVGAPGLGVTILIAAFAMTAWLPLIAWLLADGLYGPAAAFAVFPFLLLWRWYPRSAASLWALAIPVAIYAAVPMLVRGLWSALSGGATEWKGRRV